jgi:hypothetical protein
MVRPSHCGMFLSEFQEFPFCLLWMYTVCSRALLMPHTEHFHMLLSNSRTTRVPSNDSWERVSAICQMPEEILVFGYLDLADGVRCRAWCHLLKMLHLAEMLPSSHGCRLLLLLPRRRWNLASTAIAWWRPEHRSDWDLLQNHQIVLLMLHSGGNFVALRPFSGLKDWTCFSFPSIWHSVLFIVKFWNIYIYT